MNEVMRDGYRGQQSPARCTGFRQDKAGQGRGEQVTLPFWRRTYMLKINFKTISKIINKQNKKSFLGENDVK